MKAGKALWIAISLGLVACTGCCKPAFPWDDDDKDERRRRHGHRGKGADAASGEDNATPVGTNTANLAAAPACQVGSSKVWATGLNKGTSLTDTDLEDGRVAIGYAIGTSPRVLVVGSNGSGEVLQYSLPPQVGSRRDLNRVTPYKSGGQIKIAADYHEPTTKNDWKAHKIVCGPVDRPIVDELSLYFNELPADAQASAPGEIIELRDCRTFADPHKDLQWIVASTSEGKARPDGSRDWKAYLFLAFDRRRANKLAETPLSKAPTGAVFEVPVSAKMQTDDYLLGVRTGGQLGVAILNSDLTMRTALTLYPGWPTLPDVAMDGPDMVLMTSIKNGNSFSLKGLRISQNNPVVPRVYTDVVTDPGEQGSEADPDFTRDQSGQRWLAHVEGERGRGRLSIVPIDANFRATGKAYTVSRDGEKVSFAKIVPMNDGSLLVAFLRETGAAVELVTEDLRCKVANQ